MTTLGAKFKVLLLIDAENVSDSLNRKLALRNIENLCRFQMP